MQAPAQLGRRPVAANFDRLLDVNVRQFDDFSGNIFHPDEEMDFKVLRVPCSKPAQLSPPSAEELRRLAPYERAFREELEAQQRLGFDAEALDKVYVPLLKEVGDMQGIQAHTVDLSSEALKALPGLEDLREDFNERVALVNVPEDLRLLQAEVRKLTMNCHFLAEVPEWLGEFVHLEALCLNGGRNEYVPPNDALTELSEALGALHALKILTLENLQPWKS